MSYISEVLADDPYLFFLLNETSGTSAFDLAQRPGLRGSTTGTYVGGPSLGAVGLIGTNGAVQTSSSSHVVLPFPGDDIGVFFSVELWDQYVSGTAPIFRDNHTSGGWYLDLSGTHPVVGTGSGTRTVTSVASSSLKDSARHQFVITSDGSLYHLYFDGALVDSWPVTPLTPPIAYSFFLGKDGANTGHTPGIFAAVAFYGSVLSAARVAAHYAARDIHAAGKALISTAAPTVAAVNHGQAGVTVTALPVTVTAPIVPKSFLRLISTTVTDFDGPLDTPDPRVKPIHIVSPSTPTPTLVDGRPQ
jgi:hypothetical protein